MRSPIFYQKKPFSSELPTNKEYIYLYRRQDGQCTICSPHGGENQTPYTKWGRKKAMKHFYSTGKHRDLKHLKSTWYSSEEFDTLAKDRKLYR